MSEIYVMNFIKPCPGLFQAGQYPVAASSVNQKSRIAGLQHKACIIAPRNCGIARSEHYYLAFTFHLIHFRQTPQATRGPDIKNCPPPSKGPRTTCFRCTMKGHSPPDASPKETISLSLPEEPLPAPHIQACPKERTCSSCKPQRQAG